MTSPDLLQIDVDNGVFKSTYIFCLCDLANVGISMPDSLGVRMALDQAEMDRHFDPQFAKEASSVIDSMVDGAIATTKGMGKWTKDDDEFLKRLDRI